VFVRCVLPMRENKYGGGGVMGFKFVGASDGVFHSPFHASVVVFGIGDVWSLPCKMCATIARREDGVFRVEGVVCKGT
jgi:hypothetical protein